MDHSFLRNKKLLLVDDEPELLQMVTSILSDDGFRNIVAAASAKDGISMFQNENPDLAILDVMLPDGDGFSLSRMWPYLQKDILPITPSSSGTRMTVC